MTLEDLANETPPNGYRFEHYVVSTLDESDRGAAIMASALVEKCLENLIKVYLPGGAERLFTSYNAPFATFSAKIGLATALGAIDGYIEEKLTVTRKVRNAFAHRMLPMDFSHPTLVEECLKLRPDDADHEDARRAFIVHCVALAEGLNAIAKHRYDEKIASIQRGDKDPLYSVPEIPKSRIKAD